MNATSIEELRAGLDAKRDGGDDRMAQIRDLLLGDHLKASELRYAALEGRIRDLEGLLYRRIDALATRIEELAASTDAERRTSLDDMSRMIHELGENIRVLSRK